MLFLEKCLIFPQGPIWPSSERTLTVTTEKVNTLATITSARYHLGAYTKGVCRTTSSAFRTFQRPNWGSIVVTLSILSARVCHMAELICGWPMDLASWKPSSWKPSQRGKGELPDHQKRVTRQTSNYTWRRVEDEVRTHPTWKSSLTNRS